MTRTRLLEFLDFGFDYRTARALVDAGYVLAPGRFTTSGEGVNGVRLSSSKAAHDGYASGLGRPAPSPLPTLHH